MPGVSQNLESALQHHQAGRLDQAEAIYRSILARAPRNADALHLLGMVGFQRGEFAGAAERIGRAIRVSPLTAQFHNNLGLVLQALGRAEESISCFEQALRLLPTYAEAHTNLGKAFERQGRHREAAACFRQALKEKPGFIEALYNLGRALQTLGEGREAIQHFQQVLRLKPDHLEAAVNLSSALKQQDRLEEAAECCRQTLRFKPDMAEAHSNLGAILLSQERFEEAEAVCREALRLKPELAEPYANLGAILLKRERPEEAMACCEEALRRKPRSPEAHNNLGNIFRVQHNLEEARACFARALEADPDYFEGHLNLGGVLRELDLREEAIASCQEALRRKPDSAEALTHLGNVFHDQGRLEEAQDCFRQAIRCRPDLAEPYVNLGGVLKDQGRLEEAIALYLKGQALKPKSFCSLFYYLHYDTLCEPVKIFEQHRRWGQEHTRELTAPFEPHANDRTPGRRLRIGYVSGDFRTHSVAFFFEPIITSHDRKEFEVYCYSNVAKPDAVTQRFRGFAHGWREIPGLTDTQVVELIRQDRIDILVDLAGHTAGNRLLVFARKPAPVQVTYLGYLDTTGLEAIDYRLTDAWADPVGQTEHLHTEELVRLPGSFLCYRSWVDAPAVADLPALQAGTVTFGSFNYLAKLTPRMIAAWSALLRQLPGSRLILKSTPLSDESTRRLVWERFRVHGLAEDRIRLCGPLTPEEHLQLYNQIDIALDTFPYHGTTTTCEALWMGVPVVVLAGATHASRVGVSLLASVGLTDWIADSAEGYVELAAQMARDPDRLAQLRAGLRQRMAASPLSDAAGFTRHLEETYRWMWRRWRLSQETEEVTQVAVTD